MYIVLSQYVLCYLTRQRSLNLQVKKYESLKKLRWSYFIVCEVFCFDYLTQTQNKKKKTSFEKACKGICSHGKTQCSMCWTQNIIFNHALYANTMLEWDTCYVVGNPAVSRLTALAQATVPLMQQADVVLRKSCPKVSGRNCSINRKTMDRFLQQRCNNWLMYQYRESRWSTIRNETVIGEAANYIIACDISVLVT